MSKIVPVVICGGAGTRLWPASRESRPKQFIPLLGTLSSFERAMLLVTNASVFARPAVVTHADARFLVGEQLAGIQTSADVILEPERRESAAAIAVAALHAARNGPDTTVLVLAADHVIPNADMFAAACTEAARAAARGYIMTLGIKPTNPATGFGYIALGEKIEGTAARRVSRFVEKPDEQTAERYISEGYLWNSGNFIALARVLIDEIERFQPAIMDAVRRATDQGEADLDFIRLAAAPFGSAPKSSFDYAVMEKTEVAGVLPVDLAWSDIGTWDALWAESPHDRDGNAVRGNVELHCSRNNLVQSESILTALVGVDDLVVVAEPDAVLVANRARSGDVRELVASLRAKGRREADEHVRLYRPWGWHQRIDSGPRFQVKRIVVHSGGKLSLQRHFHRAEHWVVVHGTAEVTIDGEAQLVYENEAVYLPIGCTHRLANPGRVPLEIIEVQVGSYTGEDDIVRIEDVYGR